MLFLLQTKRGDFIADFPLAVTDFVPYAKRYTDVNEVLAASKRLHGSRVVSLGSAGTYSHEELRTADDWTEQRYRFDLESRN
jgi:hypothetical protein